MMHESNKKAIENWTAKRYAGMYRLYVNESYQLIDWYSLFMPEWADGKENEFLQVCRNFHNLGF